MPFVTELADHRHSADVNNTIEYQDIGIILDVTPHINPDGLVILDVVAGDQPAHRPDRADRRPASASPDHRQALGREPRRRSGTGRPIVIGGLMEDQQDADREQGADPRRHPAASAPSSAARETDKTKTELLIFLTPHVAAEPELLKPMSQDEMTRDEADAERGRARRLRGAFRGHAPRHDPRHAADHPTPPGVRAAADHPARRRAGPAARARHPSDESGDRRVGRGGRRRRGGIEPANHR